jgi:hypothetical protein
VLVDLVRFEVLAELDLSAEEGSVPEELLEAKFDAGGLSEDGL